MLVCRAPTTRTGGEPLDHVVLVFDPVDGDTIKATAVVLDSQLAEDHEEAHRRTVRHNETMLTLWRRNRDAPRWRLAMSSAAELQKSIFEALGVNAALTDLIDTHAFHHTPASASFPYMTLGRTSVYDWSTGTENGTEQLFTLHVRSKGKEEALEIMELARTTLHDAALEIDSHSLVNLRLEFSEARYDDRNEAHHGLLRFRAVVEEVGQGKEAPE